jgi:hypothetical protein
VRGIPQTRDVNLDANAEERLRVFPVQEEVIAPFPLFHVDGTSLHPFQAFQGARRFHAE